MHSLDHGDALQQAAREDSVWVSEHLGVKAGDKLRLQVNDRTSDYIVRGVLKDSGDSGSLVIMDMATAQRALQRPGGSIAFCSKFRHTVGGRMGTTNPSAVARGRRASAGGSRLGSSLAPGTKGTASDARIWRGSRLTDVSG